MITNITQIESPKLDICDEILTQTVLFGEYVSDMIVGI